MLENAKQNLINLLFYLRNSELVLEVANQDLNNPSNLIRLIVNTSRHCRKAKRLAYASRFYLVLMRRIERPTY